MRYQLTKYIHQSLIFIGVLVLGLSSCDKEVVEQEIDAFNSLNSEVSYSKGQYILQFSLADFNYKSVQVKLGTSLNDLRDGGLGAHYQAYSSDKNRYIVFFNPLTSNRTYHYQIIVEDQQKRFVNSDNYKFKTDQ